MEHDLILFADCIVTKGISHSLLIDFRRTRQWILPSDYYKYLEGRKINLQRITEQNINNQDLCELKKLVNFLLDNELVFKCPTHLSENFEKIPEIFLQPGQLHNAILEVDSTSEIPYDVVNSIETFCALGGRHVQLVSHRCIDLNWLKNILKLTQTFPIRSFELFSCNGSDYDQVNWNDLFSSLPRLSKVTVHSSDRNEILDYGNETGMGLVVRTKRKLNYQLHHDSLRKENFVFDLKYFTEAKLFNPYFNGKVCVDKDGHIKKCLSHERSFGRINEVSLTDLAESSEFRELDYINKDYIRGCRKCEYRYVCTDSRTPLKGESDWFHDSDCFYNFIEGTWSNNA